MIRLSIHKGRYALRASFIAVSLAALLAPAYVAAQVKLIYSTYTAKGTASNEQYEAYLEELGKRSNGFVGVKDRFYSAALMKAGDQLTGIGKRIADVGYFCTGYTPALLPLTSMAELPYVAEKGDAVSAALVDLYDSYEPLRREYNRQNVEVLAFDAPSSTIIGVNKVVNSAADLKNLKVRAYGDLGKIAQQAGGMVPVAMATSDIYTGLQTGTIDGYLGIPLWMPAPENWLQHTKTILAPGIGTYYTCGLAMNLDVYKGLPDNVKAEITKMRREFPAKSIAFVEKGDAVTVAKGVERGVKFYRFTPQEVAAWKKGSNYDALVADWIKTRQSRTDANVTEFLKMYQAAYNKHAPQSKYEQKLPK
jgi:TRAP-type C4-dicarboxylate transport system substrate-binding protein